MANKGSQNKERKENTEKVATTIIAIPLPERRLNAMPTNRQKWSFCVFKFSNQN